MNDITQLANSIFKTEELLTIQINEFHKNLNGKIAFTGEHHHIDNVIMMNLNLYFFSEKNIITEINELNIEIALCIPLTKKKPDGIILLNSFLKEDILYEIFKNKNYFNIDDTDSVFNYFNEQIELYFRAALTDKISQTNLSKLLKNIQHDTQTVLKNQDEFDLKLRYELAKNNRDLFFNQLNIFQKNNFNKKLNNLIPIKNNTQNKNKNKI